MAENSPMVCKKCGKLVVLCINDYMMNQGTCDGILDHEKHVTVLKNQDTKFTAIVPNEMIEQLKQKKS